MKLGKIELGNVLGASGVQGFFGEGWWFHWLMKFFGLDLSGMTFVAKTATLEPRKGNVKSGFFEMVFPSWVRIKFRRGAMLNAMGLPNPGIRALLATGKWQARKDPFMI